MPCSLNQYIHWIRVTEHKQKTQKDIKTGTRTDRHNYTERQADRLNDRKTDRHVRQRYTMKDRQTDRINERQAHRAERDTLKDRQTDSMRDRQTASLCQTKDIGL